MYLLQVLWDTIWTILGWFWQIIVAFGSYLGIGEWFAKSVLAFIIIAILVCSPFAVSKRDKQMAKKTASIIVDTVNRFRK